MTINSRLSQPPHLYTTQIMMLTWTNCWTVPSRGKSKENPHHRKSSNKEPHQANIKGTEGQYCVRCVARKPQKIRAWHSMPEPTRVRGRAHVKCAASHTRGIYSVLSYHMSVHSADNEHSFPCEICGRKCMHNHGLKLRDKLHKGKIKRPFSRIRLHEEWSSKKLQD